jgi:hypothetical protein
MFQNATKEKRRILIVDGDRDSPRLVKSPERLGQEFAPVHFA